MCNNNQEIGCEIAKEVGDMEGVGEGLGRMEIMQDNTDV